MAASLTAGGRDWQGTRFLLSRDPPETGGGPVTECILRTGRAAWLAAGAGGVDPAPRRPHNRTQFAAASPRRLGQSLITHRHRITIPANREEPWFQVGPGTRQ